MLENLLDDAMHVGAIGCLKSMMAVFEGKQKAGLEAISVNDLLSILQEAKVWHEGQVSLKELIK